jgi:hypothetical protein
MLGRGLHEVIVHRTVMENTTASTQFPMLTLTNYQEWVILMQVNFKVVGWWYVFEPEDHHDPLALAAILHSVPTEMLSGLHGKRMTAWEAIKWIHVRVQHVCEANTQVRCNFGALVWKEAENTKDFMNRIIGC